MSTIMVQSPTGTWIPVGHLIVSEECGDTVEAGLLKLREWAPKWQWYYCLIDDSSRERKGLRAALPGIRIFLCTVHSRRTMQKHLGKQSTSLEFLNRAMHRYTEAGCVEDIDRAINRATTNKAKLYIKKQYRPVWRRRIFGLFARQHSTWLMQNTATQAIEGALIEVFFWVGPISQTFRPKQPFGAQDGVPLMGRVEGQTKRKEKHKTRQPNNTFTSACQPSRNPHQSHASRAVR